MLSFQDVRSIIVRKAIHFLAAFIPLLAAMNFSLVVGLLCAGIVFYAFIESYRLAGTPPSSLLSKGIRRVIEYASHRRDKDRFVLGPLTLGAGSLSALLFFPPQAAEAAIYSLALGDALAGLAGKTLGRLRPRFLSGKSIEGSLACFLAIFLSTFAVTHNGITALLCGISGALVEALPIEDFDNIFLPFTVGTVAVLSLGF